MWTARFSLSASALATLVALAGCAEDAPPPPLPGVAAWSGATVWDGTGAPPIEDAVVLVEHGRIAAVGPANEVDVPAGAAIHDLSGMTVVPGLVNAHAHASGVRGLEDGHYNRENLLRQLGLYARYGVTSIISLGGDGPEAAALRDEQDENLDRARIWIAGEVISGGSPEEAAESVARSLALPADFLKMRVDTNLGANERVSSETIGTVMELAAEAGKRVTTHIFYLDDAKEVLRAGSGLIAHSVRDQPVDEEFVDLMKEKDVCYVPTLVREISTFVYADVPEFFEDPFFLAEADPAVLDQLRDPERMAAVASSPAAQGYREHYPVAMANLKAVADAGVTIAFGTDTGPSGRFQGYFEHVETGEMSEAGLSAEAILLSATRDAAACLALDDIGTLTPGRWADFLVLAEKPARRDLGASLARPGGDRRQRRTERFLGANLSGRASARPARAPGLRRRVCAAPTRARPAPARAPDRSAAPRIRDRRGAPAQPATPARRRAPRGGSPPPGPPGGESVSRAPPGRRRAEPRGPDRPRRRIPRRDPAANRHTAQGLRPRGR